MPPSTDQGRAQHCRQPERAAAPDRVVRLMPFEPPWMTRGETRTNPCPLALRPSGLWRNCLQSTETTVRKALVPYQSAGNKALASGRYRIPLKVAEVMRLSDT